MRAGGTGPMSKQDCRSSGSRRQLEEIQATVGDIQRKVDVLTELAIGISVVLDCNDEVLNRAQDAQCATIRAVTRALAGLSTK